MANVSFPDIKVVILGLTYDSTTLIYSVNDDSYTVGPVPSVDVTSPATVPYGDSFILIGGHDYYSFTDSTGTEER